MAITNHQRVTRAMEWLRTGLAPFVERELRAATDDGAQLHALAQLAQDPSLKDKDIAGWDVAALLRAMAENWNEVFGATLSRADRNVVFELRDHRNRWAHQEQLSSDDVYRVLDSTERLLKAVSAPEGTEVERAKLELLRLRFDEQARSERRRSAGTTIDSGQGSTLRPWREVITPHDDVASGRYQQAEFAADLWQVHLGEGGPEYKDPVEFFRRTYLTESLRQLLVKAIQRVSTGGGDPVVQLQTNFGGGKTHSMLALYHLFGRTDAIALPGVDNLLAEAGAQAVPTVKRVVLVGNKISPGNPAVKGDGTVVKTLWGELAYQLGGKKAYDTIKNDDKNATNPGDTLRRLFNEYGPCLILIDEWVAYARQLHDDPTLPGGTFDTQFSFAQALTESARLARNALLVVSLPASDTATASPLVTDDVEVGGIRGRQALDRLRNVIGRVESSWRPASAEEGFEIVRRRLFNPITDNSLFRARDNVAHAYAELYRTQAQEFPPETREGEYEKRIKAAYPIHPEVFDRLYGDWSTLVKFQRTRGVLRLMASVIHALWQGGDRNPLIQPANIPIDDSRVQFELTRYLSENWPPIIERDIDGPSSTPARIDDENPNLGRYQATRRVARTIYLGSAPTTDRANAGLEDRRIKLGCAVPGESPAVFGDALRRLASSATYLFSDGPRYWYSTTPTVAKLADDRAEQLRREPDRVYREIETRLHADIDRQRGDFVRTHVLPGTSGDVPDDYEARLVVLSPDHPHVRSGESAALAAAEDILEKRGNTPRQFRNSVVFLAADEQRLEELEDSVRRFLAWQSIVSDVEILNLRPDQARQARDQLKTMDGTVASRLPETYLWLLVPSQTDPRARLTIEPLRLSGTDPLAVRASKKLRGDELLVTNLGATSLRLELDRIPLWRGDHVSVQQLIQDFASYPYLPRLREPSVLTEAISNGLGNLAWRTETFAYAERYDAEVDRYAGLMSACAKTIRADDPGLVVKGEAAERQFDKDRAEAPSLSVSGVEPVNPDVAGRATLVEPERSTSTRRMPTRFHATVELDPTRLAAEAGKVNEHVFSYLSSKIGANACVTLEIHVHRAEGFDEQTVRTVSENASALKFESHGFEDE